MPAVATEVRRPGEIHGAPGDIPRPYQQPDGGSPTGNVDAALTGLYRAGAVAALAIVGLIPVQAAAWLAWPPPVTVEGFFARFQQSWLLGLLSLDLLYPVTVVLLVPLLLALAVSLRRVSPPAVALALGLVAIGTYFASNSALEMLSLSTRYAAATADAQRERLLAAAMRRSADFGETTAYAGVLSGVLMLVPSTAGVIGLICALASLVPWAVISLLAARRLYVLGQHSTRVQTA